MPTAFSEVSAAAALLRGILAGDPPAPEQAVVAPPPEPLAGDGTHAGLIERELQAACRRLQATSAVVADVDGLAVASFGTATTAADSAPVTAAVLGDAVAHAARILGSSDEPQVTLRLSAAERLVLRRFEVGGRPFNLLLTFRAGVAEPGSLGPVAEALARVLAEDASTGRAAP
jgi:hypothetical protein